MVDIQLSQNSKFGHVRSVPAPDRVRLTLRMNDEMDALIRNKAEESGMTMNQAILTALNQWAKSHRSPVRTP